MKTPLLKFCHEYTKLCGQKSAKLLSVEMLSKSDLSAEMVCIDTEYTESDGSTQHYNKLPNGLVLVLVFVGNKNIPFTTIRRCYDKKLQYYRSLVGQWFDIVVEEDDVKEIQEQLVI
jgi:hypothetical protein